MLRAGAGPGLSPLLGSALTEHVGWRSIFGFLSCFAVVNLVLVVAVLRESIARSGHSAGAVVRNYAGLLSSGRFLGYAVGGGCATTSMYAFIGAAPFIFVTQLGRPMPEVGYYLAVNILGVWFGNLTAIRLIARLPIRQIMVMGNGVSCLAAAMFFAVAVSGHLSVAMTVGPMVVLCYGAGMASPMAMASALNVNPAVAGSSSGLYGFAQMAIGAGCTALAGFGDDPALAAASTLLGAGVVAQISFWFASHGRATARLATQE